MVAKLRAFNERRGRFERLRDANVLLYWPHGLGDWAHLATILPLLEPSNRYFITRFGDDFVSVMEGNSAITPLYCGTNKISEGSAFGPPHLGLDYRKLDGRERNVHLPPPLDGYVHGFGIDAVLYTDYPEPEGRARFPYHTKARALAKLLVTRKRLEQFDLSAPLPTTLSFGIPEVAAGAVDRALAIVGEDVRLGILALRGHTNDRKNWPPSEAAAFIDAMLAHDHRWCFIVVDDQPLHVELRDRALAFSNVFSEVAFPFATLYKALLMRAQLFVGVPAGPLHLAMAKGDLPVVGIWQAHHPDWYDEPNPNAFHLIGNYVRKRGFHRRPAVRSKPDRLKDSQQMVDSEIIPARYARDAALALVYGRGR